MEFRFTISLIELELEDREKIGQALSDQITSVTGISTPLVQMPGFLELPKGLKKALSLWIVYSN